jgi:hypothetical protein
MSRLIWEDFPVLLSLLAAMWMWDRVLTNCRGEIETASYYYFQATVKVATLTTCLDDQGQPYPCTLMMPAAPMRFTTDIPDLGMGTTVSTAYDPVMFPETLLPTPPVGGLTAWPWETAEGGPVVAVDEAENKSGSPCP